ncbi:MAG: potassium channel family protein [Dehalococcoides mccartyi]|uniref:potassium channel family protein n=1 Tax=Dehalococcoides mccartyi TaxID=61435 RepID=UPI0030F81C3A
MIDTLKRFSLAFILLLIGVAIGTIGFIALEGFTPLESFYLTVSTITLVGYGDVVPVTTGGRVLAMGLVVTGFIFFASVIITSIRIVLERREQKNQAQQRHTLIALFLNEIGSKLLRFLCQCDPAFLSIRDPAQPEKVWTTEDFEKLADTLKRHSFNIDPRRSDWNTLDKLLDSRILLRFLEDPYVLEYPLFNSLLRAIFHLKDELSNHPDFVNLSDAVLDHIATDMKKVYQPIVNLWLEYMRYLEKTYPSLFLTVMESSPFGITKAA